MIIPRPNNTRLNPTTNGNLHLGHIYMALVNECEAHSTGGKFTVRFDDDQEATNLCVPFAEDKHIVGNMEVVKAQMVEDLEWMGIQVDRWQSQSTSHERMETLMLHVNKGPLSVRKVFVSVCNPELQWANWDASYPYVPWFTAEKVIYDFMGNINLLIRGEDLLDEFSLYSYFCDLWGLANPRQVYLSRLMLHTGEQLADVSKTKGSNSIAEYRDKGWDPKALKQALAHVCLVDPDGPWLISNVKPRPVWNL